MPNDYEAKVLPQVAPSVDIPMAYTPQALGAGVGQAIQGLGETAHNVYVRAQEHANRTAVLDADNQQQAFVQARLYDPKTGALNKPLGKDAPGEADQALADYDQHVNDVAGRLSNEAQKEHFQQMAAERRLQVQGQLDKWEHDQVTTWSREVAGASVENAKNMAVQHAGNDPIVADNLNLMRDVIQHQGEDDGLPPARIEELQRKAVSATNLDVIRELVATGRDGKASNWFGLTKGEMTGEDRIAGETMVAAGTTAGEAQRIAEEFTKTADGKPIDRQALQDKIDQDPRLKKDIKLRDAVESRAFQRLEGAHQAQSEQERKSFTQAYGIARSSPQGLNDDALVPLLATMSPEHQEYLRSALAKGDRDPDPLRMRDLSMEAATAPDAFLGRMQADAPALLAELGRKGFDQLTTMEKEIRQKGSLSNANQIQSQTQVVDRALAAAGFKTVSSAGNISVNRNAPGAEQFLRVLESNLAEEANGKGRALLPSEAQAVADRVVIERSVSPAGFLYGYKDDKAIADLTPEQRDLSRRSVAEFAKLSPAAATEAVQFQADATAAANRLGVVNDLTPDQFDRAFAQRLIGQDRKASGDEAGYLRAKARYEGILREGIIRRSADAMQAREEEALQREKLRAIREGGG